MSTPTKPTGPDLTAAQDRVLDALIDAYPRGVATSDLLLTVSTAAKSRIGELRRMGWNIDMETDTGVVTYRLVSLTRIAPPPATILGLKCVAREDGTVTPTIYAETAGVLPPDVEARLLARVRSAMSDAIREACLQPEPELVQSLPVVDSAADTLLDWIASL